MRNPVLNCKTTLLPRQAFYMHVVLSSPLQVFYIFHLKLDVNKHNPFLPFYLFGAYSLFLPNIISQCKTWFICLHMNFNWETKACGAWSCLENVVLAVSSGGVRE